MEKLSIRIGVLKELRDRFFPIRHRVHIKVDNVRDNRVAGVDCPIQSRPAPRLRFIALLCIQWVGDSPDAIDEKHQQAFIRIEHRASRIK